MTDDDHEDNRKSRESYGFAMAVFGASIMFSLCVPFRIAAKLEDAKVGSFSASLGNLGLEWVYILIGVAIPYLVWRVLVVPTK